MIITISQFNDTGMMKLVSTLRQAAGPDTPLFPLCTQLLPDIVDFSAGSNPTLPSQQSLSVQPSAYQAPYTAHSPSVGPLIVPEPWVYSGEGYLFPSLMSLVEDSLNMEEYVGLGVGVILYVE